MKRLLAVWLLPMAISLGGCELLQIPRGAIDKDASFTGAGSLINWEDFEPVNLVGLLDPERRGDYPDPVVDKGAEIDLAFHAFFIEYPAATRRQRRDAVQENILASSNQRCGYFKNYLHATRSTANFFLGSLATITGTVGALVTGASAARALAGTSAIFSGVRAEYNQELFANLATNVITSGISLRRQQVYNQIVLQGQTKSYDIYNVEAAVKDAIFYHSQCSVIVGFEVASDTIELSKDPGIDTANRVLAKLKITRKLLQDDDLTPQESIEVLTGSTALLQAGTPRGQASIAELDPLGVLVESKESVKDKSLEMLDHLIGLLILKKIKPDNKDAFDKKIKTARGCAIAKVESFAEEAKTKTEALAIARIGLRRAQLQEGASEADLLEAQWVEKAAEADARGTSLKIEQVSSLLEAYYSEAQKVMTDDLERNEGELSVKALDKATVAIDRALKIDPMCEVPSE